MILIADSGSTKTDWCLTDGAYVKRFSTAGTNPVFQSREEIERVIGTELMSQTGDIAPDAVYFYGAGCGSEEKIECVRSAIMHCMKVGGNDGTVGNNETVGNDGTGGANKRGGTIEVNSDMLAAARALCGREAGIACILGTGSNSCFYDGEKIVSNVSPLGFILGDEGSGACLGKLLIGNLLKGQMGDELKRKFDERYGLSTADIIERVYRRPFPNRFLASFSPFILENIGDERMRTMVLEGFKAFIRRNVMHYDYKHYPVHFTGSVASLYIDVLKEAAEDCGISLGRVMKCPMEGLIGFHSSL